MAVAPNGLSDVAGLDGIALSLHTTGCSALFLFLCLDLKSPAQSLHSPELPMVFSQDAAALPGAGGVGVGGGVLSGDSRPVFTPAACPKRCGSVEL